MFLAAYLALLSGQFPVDPRAGENKLTQLRLEHTPHGYTFAWSDADESLKGQVSPQPLRVGRTLTVSAVLQPLQGEDYRGPLTFSLRPLHELGSTQSVTVERAKDAIDGGAEGPRGWVAQFTPDEATDYRLEVSWRSTHHKVVRGVVSVKEGGLPPWLTWTMAGGLIAVALSIGLWILFGRKESASS
jgi:hypothetical protein